MEVRKGYKQTEVGVIPENWEIYSGEQITTLIGKGASPRWQGFEYSDSGMLFVTSENVRDGYLDVSAPKYLPLEFHEKLKRTKLQKNDILINLVGASIGRSCQIREELGEANVNQAVAVFRVNNQYSSSFIAFYFQEPLTVKRILDMQVDAARQNISLGNLRGFQIPLPPTLAEQEAIAEALSDADALIESLETLLAKKRQVKQGAMSELLTGKRRVVESGKWEEKTIGELGNCFAGGTPSTFNSAFWNGDIFWLPSGRVQNCILDNPVDDEIKITKLGLQNSAAKLIKAHSVLVAITGATCGNIASLEFEAAANQSVVAIEPINSVNYRFLYYSLLMKRNAILSLQSGSAQGGVNLRAVKSIIVDCPSLPEQTAIAEILSDMDAEIRAVEEKLSKARAVKAGMMSALLTGRVRLV